jgi:predicted RND superfamily exporter protein
MTAENTPRSTSTLSRKSFKRTKVRKLQDVEKEIEKIERIERSITPSPARAHAIRAKVTGRLVGKSQISDVQDKLRKENEMLKAEVFRLERIIVENEKVKEDYENLLVAFEKSEKIRNKQKEVIAKLKTELRTFI